MKNNFLTVTLQYITLFVGEPQRGNDVGPAIMSDHPNCCAATMSEVGLTIQKKCHNFATACLELPQWLPAVGRFTLKLQPNQKAWRGVRHWSRRLNHWCWWDQCSYSHKRKNDKEGVRGSHFGLRRWWKCFGEDDSGETLVGIYMNMVLVTSGVRIWRVWK